MKFCDQVKKAREEKGLSIKDLSELANIPLNILELIESDKLKLTTKEGEAKKAELSDILDVEFTKETEEDKKERTEEIAKKRLQRRKEEIESEGFLEKRKEIREKTKERFEAEKIEWNKVATMITRSNFEAFNITSPEDWFEFSVNTIIGLSTEWEMSSDPNKYDLVIPETINGSEVRIIEYYALQYRGIKTIYLPDSITYLDTYSLSDNPLEIVSIPGGVFVEYDSIDDIFYEDYNYYGAGDYVWNSNYYRWDHNPRGSLLGPPPVIKPNAPSLNKLTGVYDSAQTITVTPDIDAVSTYYTLDGTDPDNSKVLLVGNTIEINGANGETVTLKIASYNSENVISTILTEFYLFAEPIQTGWHQADMINKKWKIELTDLMSYISAYLSNNLWNGEVIGSGKDPIKYVTNAVNIYRQGETYNKIGKSEPECWVFDEIGGPGESVLPLIYSPESWFITETVTGGSLMITGFTQEYQRHVGSLDKFKLVIPESIGGNLVSGVRLVDNYTESPGANLITSINMSHVTTVPNGGFYGLNNLTSANMQSAATIADRAFSFCYRLEEIDIRSAIIIGEYAFDGVLLSDPVIIPLTTDIGQNGFRNTKITEAHMPLVTRIRYGVFDGCYDLVEVYAPSVNIIDSYSFENCNSISKITLGANANINATARIRDNFKTIYDNGGKLAGTYEHNGTEWIKTA